MRIALLLTVLTSVAAQAHAEDPRAQGSPDQGPRAQGPRESRYGPTSPRQAAATAVAATARYDGPMLNWAGKREVSVAVAAPPPPAPTLPTPVAGWAGYQTAPAPPAYTPPPPAPAFAPASAPPPTSLYAAPRAPQSTATRPVATQARPLPAPAPAVDWSNYRSSRMASVAPAAAPAPAPANLYAQPVASQPIARQAATAPTSPTPAPPQPRQVAAMAPGATGARFYSVDREYGMTPDAIPPAGPNTHVLITAAEPPPEAKDAVPLHGSADWLAAGVRGDDEDDSSTSKDRRA
jgi:hypothetical protein